MLHTFSSSLSLFLFIVPVAAELSRSSFPPGFIFGTASSAYQYEGATDEGKGPSIWDTYTHEHSEKIDDHSNGDVANDQYHRYKEDVQLMKDLGMDAYRFSISWSRILPSGKLRGGLNREGINYYNNLINYLIANGMKPFVTLFHWDLPQSLEDEYGGFLSNMIIQDYMDYANVCFEAFGDRVKHWITINEPYTFSAFGYGEGRTAPGRCSVSVGNCSTGNSATEPYIVGHNMLLAHAAAVKLYKDKYQGYQKGVIGISLVTPWFVPYSPSRADQDATQRAIDFNFGWFMDPLTSGGYPLSMRSLVGERLPKFLEEEAKAVNGSFDFIGINYYTSNYAADIDHRKCKGTKLAYTTDPYAYLTGEKNGIPIGRQAASKWLYVYPKGIRDLLVYTKNRYNNPVIYITENGVDELNNVSLPLEEALKDHMRIEYHQKHLSFVEKSIRKGVDLRGYFVWSLLDDFEWYFGYAFRFGIYLVDYKDGLKRYPKESATWFRKFLQKGNLSLDNNDPHTRNKLLHVAC